MRLLRAVATLGLFAMIAWAAWFIAWYAAINSSGATFPPPPGVIG